ncbi:MAG TPA: ABC transporter permease, partial [Isosphaeraceae bacterium]|nr:ABC transporter permease [Isosphaeraceae bacterium]
MRNRGWLILGLCAAISTAALSAKAAEAPRLGSGPAYEALGQMAVLHQGRVKPLDTMSRQVIKQFYGDETITFFDAEGKRASSWGPVGAFLDMSARPEFWNDQPIIRVVYMPLKRMLLAGTAQQELRALAQKPATAPADKTRLEALAREPVITPEALAELAKTSQLPEADRKTLAALGARLGASLRWVSPREIEDAKVTVEGQSVPFEMWVADIVRRFEPDEEGPMVGRPKLPELEKNARDCAVALRHYQAIRGDRVRFLEPLDLVMPRPSSAAHLTYLADVQKKYTTAAHGESKSEPFTPMEEESARALEKYLKDLPREDWHMPGTDKAFDTRFAAWLREKSAWVPLSVLMESDAPDLVRAGFPSAKVEAFRSAYKALVDAEIASPGQISVAPAAQVVQTARELGESVGIYPSREDMTRETRFNAFAPFTK